MPIKPTNNKILMKLIEKVKVTPSGIVLSSADPLEPNYGDVIKVGPKVETVKPKDKVLPDWKKAVKVVIKDHDYYIITEENIVAVMDVNDE
jgi:co-chaperonin GroES (HSP10)